MSTTTLRTAAHVALLLLAGALAALPGCLTHADEINGPDLHGARVAAELAEPEMMWNIGSRIDGAGMCVMTSIEMAARYAGLDEYRGLRDWCARESGGGWPEKVDRQLAAYAKAKGLAPPLYIQYEGPDPGPLLLAASKSRRLATMTYGYCPRYASPTNPKGEIAHMVACPLWEGPGGAWGVVLDNNQIGGVKPGARYEWLTGDELLKRVKWPPARPGRRGDIGWVFVWLEVPPPPPPSNF